MTAVVLRLPTVCAVDRKAGGFAERGSSGREEGIDIIRCDDTARIVEFRVMIRPLQAVNAVHEQMREMLASMQP